MSRGPPRTESTPLICVDRQVSFDFNNALVFCRDPSHLQAGNSHAGLDGRRRNASTPLTLPDRQSWVATPGFFSDVPREISHAPEFAGLAAP